MPDWSYQTVFRPLLFRLPAAAARDLTLGFMGRLARLPFGPALIDFLGHMRPPEALARSLLGLSFPTPVGLGPGIDPHAVALPALARFGLGFLEFGPVTLEPVEAEAVPAVERRGDQALWYPDVPANVGLAEAAQRLARAGPLGVPLMVRLAARPGSPAAQVGEQWRRMVVELAPFADIFALAPPACPPNLDPWVEEVQLVLRTAKSMARPRPVLVVVAPDLAAEMGEALVDRSIQAGVAGFLVDGTVGCSTTGRVSGLPAREPALATVRHLRQRCGKGSLVIASGGVHEPAHALELFHAGADLVQVDSGLVYSGPGLPKRINESLLFAQEPTSRDSPPRSRPAEMSWFWTSLMGAGMLGGGILACIIAASYVVLPYDEVFSGMTRAELAAINDRLLAFMAHDRVSLAGTMITIGLMYLLLSLYGTRRGLHWAQVAVLASAFSGFGTFFLFLGFGYFDPFHAFVTAILFQFLLLGLHARLGPLREQPPPNLHNDWRWRWGLWGQLIFVVHGAGLIGAGLMISGIGVTSVFVHEDLEFMQTTAEALTQANPKLLPLVAHDRASFGGMLVASGILVLLTALWGFRQGSYWLWWTLLLGGLPAYAAGIGVHLAVGYTNLWHLAPAIGGFAFFTAGLGLCYPYLSDSENRLAADWNKHLGHETNTR
jgi:dihydroorotate dehydrogenase